MSDGHFPHKKLSTLPYPVPVRVAGLPPPQISGGWWPPVRAASSDPEAGAPPTEPPAAANLWWKNCWFEASKMARW